MRYAIEENEFSILMLKRTRLPLVFIEIKFHLFIQGEVSLQVD